MQKPPPILVVDRFPEILNALLDLLTSLSAADWERPTVAAGWTVKDIALHLLGDDIGLLSTKRDSFTEPEISIATWDELVTRINERNDTWIQATRRISPRLLCDLLKLTGDQASAYFRSLDPEALGGPISWAGPEPAPVWLDVAREFTERWHHQQHIRDAVGKPGLMEPHYLAPVLATFVHALPQTYRQVDAPQGTCLTLTITGESGGSWSVLREEGRWQLYIGKPPRPHAEVELPEEAAWRVFTRGMTKDIARTQAVLLGDQTLAVKMLETISIIA
jgi:uncharacterized protein (TIGR03083 family)